MTRQLTDALDQRRPEMTMSSMTSLRRWPERFVPAGLLSLSLLPLLTPIEAHSKDQDSTPPIKLEVVLLLDRSPSANAKRVSGRPVIEERAQKFLSQLHSLCQFYGLELRYGAANFGGKLGEVRPLKDVSSHSDLILPARQQISFTDFRAPIRFGLETLQQEPKTNQSLHILFLFTDAEPWPASGALDSEDKERYFGDARAGTPGGLAALTRSLGEAGVDFYVVALDDRHEDELHWSGLLPPGHYLSNRLHGDLDDAVRRILLRLLGTECGPSTLADTGPLDIREIPSAAQQRQRIALPSGLRRPWYEITIALAGVLFGSMLSRVWAHHSTLQSVSTPAAEIEDLPEDERYCQMLCMGPRVRRPSS